MGFTLCVQGSSSNPPRPVQETWRHCRGCLLQRAQRMEVKFELKSAVFWEKDLFNKPNILLKLIIHVFVSIVFLECAQLQICECAFKSMFLDLPFCSGLVEATLMWSTYLFLPTPDGEAPSSRLALHQCLLSLQHIRLTFSSRHLSA